MTVQNLWPLAFLVIVPVIILLYLLKQKVKDQSFSSTMLWQEIYKNLEAKTPFEKLKQNILMYMQILLMLLLIFALMTPVLKRGGIQENTVIVIDNSASMQYLYDDHDTRLEHSLKEAKKEIDRLSENAMVTLITCGKDAAVIYQGRDKSTLKKRLNGIEAVMEAGTPDVAAGVINSVIEKLNHVQIICYTDTAFSSNDWIKNNKNASLIVEDVYSKGENCSLDYVNYSVTEDGVEALCRITNYGEREITQDVSLYAGSDIADVQTVTVKPKESETVYFEKQNIVLDGSMVLRGELSGKDSLMADNSQSIAVTADTEKKVLLLSEGNVFLEKSLLLNDNVTVYKSDDVNVLNQAVGDNGQNETFDLYVFDGIELPEDFDVGKFPEDAGFLFFNYAKDFYDSGYMVKDSEVSDTVLYFDKSPVTGYIEAYSFGIVKAYTYVLPDWGQPFLKTGDGGVTGYFGTDGKHNIGVLGFDIHNTDFALQTEFPIFMSQLGDMLLGTGTEETGIVNFPVSEESDVIPVDSVTVKGDGNHKKTGGRAIRNLLLLAAVLLLAAEWIVYIRQVNTTKKKQFLAVRILVICAVILAMAGVSVSKKQKKTETIFLVDVSDSMSGNLERTEQYLKDVVKEMPEKNLLGIVAFGKDTAVDQFLSDKKNFSGFTVEPVMTATNIEKAVTNSCSMFDEGVTKRLVLITDGSENEGSMSMAASALKGSDVELLAIVMEDSIGGNHEVYVSGVSVPNVIHAGDHYNVTVSVTSNVETDALLSLYAGRIAKGQQSIHLNKGENQFVFEDVGEEGSIARYKAVIEPDQDTISVNNTYVAFAEIAARPRVLLIEGMAGEGSEFEKILAAANIEYDKVTPKGAPVTLSGLNQYKAVITLNVHYDDLRAGFVKILESYVKDFAGGYICIGGENSFALGNYRNTVLEEILPVNMDLQGEKEIPKIAMAMAVDQSGSMTSPSEDNTSVTGLDLAKQAALSGVSELRSSDEIGILAFDDTYHWIVPMQEASDIEQIKEDISSIGYGGGTSIYPALQQAYEQILKSNGKIKHIILLTDGQDGYNQYDGLLKQINEAGITVSTVAVGSDSDQATLQHIAETCGGRFYYTDVNNSIPRIFAQEVYLSTKTYLINEEFYPSVTSNHEILEGVMDEGCPAFLGYVAAAPKQTADVILESDRKDPVLSAWQCGLGRTVAWNSDGNNEWTAQYAGWEQYPMLWSNIVHYVISDSELGDDNLEVVKEGNTASITYETKDYDKDTKVAAVVTDENGTAKEVPLDAVKPGVFETELDMTEIGVYNVSIRKLSGDEIVKNYNTAYANQYSAEYQFADGDTDFASFVKQTGGREISFGDNVWKGNSNTVKARISLTVPLLVIAILMFLFDIIIRRFSIDILVYGKRGQSMVKMWLKGYAEKRRHPSVQISEQIGDDAMTGLTIQKEQVALQSQDVESESKRESKNILKKTGGLLQQKEQKQEEREPALTDSDKLDMSQLLKKKRERE
ncbi:MAG: VWA domain-containing protein [Lachnospiraceae bacterium]|nr:VWA domain-containing protein [Lachnospiraceae bacterium]